MEVKDLLEWIPLVMLIGACIGFGYKFLKDTQSESMHDGEIKAELAAINANTAEMKETLKEQGRKQDENHLETSQRLTAVEASCRSAHHRIDDLQKGVIK